MRVVAIPFHKEGFINFWKIVKITDEAYIRALEGNTGIIVLNGKTPENIEEILKREKTRLEREKWEVAKAKAMMRLSSAEKLFWKELTNSKVNPGTLYL